MSDAVGAVLAVIVAFALFVVGGWFYFRKPDADQPAQVDLTVERTWTATTTNVAIAFIKQALAPGRRRDQDDRRGGQQSQPTEPEPDEQVRIERTRPQTPPPPPRRDTPVVDSASTTQVEVVVERSAPPAIAAPPSAIAAPPADEQPIAPAPPLELEGIDMSQAPLAPAGDGTTMRLPTVPQLQEALATGGFERFMAWLRAFFRSSGYLEADARNVHEDAMDVAKRARNKYNLALQAFHAVQADGLDNRTVTRMWEALATAEQEANAAALVTHATARLVVACGGGQPTVAAVISALDYGHGDIARAVRSAPVRVVRRITFYEN
ncbi:hypothetical protein ACFMQL_20720 [Nonomuraea fastidiosa]|uniref:hypothetical protein n=1 Tax=Nonomuraea fastidiosa TaxID=46173 RepID=UPI00366EFCEC